MTFAAKILNEKDYCRYFRRIVINTYDVYKITKIENFWKKKNKNQQTEQKSEKFTDGLLY